MLESDILPEEKLTSSNLPIDYLSKKSMVPGWFGAIHIYVTFEAQIISGSGAAR